MSKADYTRLQERLWQAELASGEALMELQEKARVEQLRFIPMVLCSVARLRKILGGSPLTNQKPTANGMGFTVDSTKAMTVEISPMCETVKVIDNSGVVPTLMVMLDNGCLDETSQVLIVGHVQRIKTANRTGQDPINGVLDLGVMP